MFLYIFIGIIIGLGLFLILSKRNKTVNLQSASNQQLSNHNLHGVSKHEKSEHNKKKGGCCCG